MFGSLRSMPVIMPGHKLRAVSLLGATEEWREEAASPMTPTPQTKTGANGGGCQAFLNTILNPFSPHRRKRRGKRGREQKKTPRFREQKKGVIVWLRVEAETNVKTIETQKSLSHCFSVD